MIVERWPAVVVGSGLAGMTAALSLEPLQTLVLTKTDGEGGSTPWAQGGVAFPRDAADIPLHINDTLISGAGHTDATAAEFLVGSALEARSWLESEGVVFDREPGGGYVYGREGAHSARRVLHVGADATGFGLAQAMARRVRSTPRITTRSRTFVVKLVEGGVLTLEADRGPVLILSPRIFLAAGGMGQLFDAATAPAEGTGDAIALALEAGIPVADLEMVQFHPTALGVRRPGAPSLSLLTEALRGDGAVLVTADGKGGILPLDTGHPLGSLGPRDVLSRAIFRREKAGFAVWLDARSVTAVHEHFPTVTKLCAEVGLDPARDLLPVVPAAHYTMGGVVTDLRGRSDRHGVWAAGEAARTGVHGANRLASNSLLECVVFGRAAAEDALAHPGPVGDPTDAMMFEPVPDVETAHRVKAELQASMTLAAGPVRDAQGLLAGLERLSLYEARWEEASTEPLSELTFGDARTILETANLLRLGREVLNQALARKSSLGAHFRSDSVSVLEEAHARP
jgi:L-aspartate oxidase